MRLEIIAELGSNHGGSLKRALALVRAAAQAGADTVKFQVFWADTLWRGNDPRHAVTQALEVHMAWIPYLMAEAEECKVNFLATPFDVDAIETLDNLGAKRFKIASGDITFAPLLDAIARAKKPVLLSTGGATNSEIESAIGRLRAHDRNLPITLLHCVSIYPAAPSEMNLPRILDLVDDFVMGSSGISVGLSSHTLAWHVDLAAISYGLACIEKHFDLSEYAGVERGHSLLPDEFMKFVSAIRDVEVALTVPVPYPSLAEEYEKTQARRNPEDWLRPYEKTS